MKSDSRDDDSPDAPGLSESQIASFERLSRLVSAWPSPGQLLSPMHAVFGGANVMFEGDGFLEYQRLVRLLVGNALSSGGPGPTEVEAAIARASRRAMDHGLERGLADLTEFVTRPLRLWTVVEPIRGHFSALPIRLGRSTIYGALESVPAIGPTSGMAITLASDTPPPVLVTRVFAHDEASAVRRARDQFDESKAVLMIVADRVRPSDRAWTVLDEDGNATATHDSGESYDLPRLVEDGGLPVGYVGLEAAATKEPAERNDWEARTLAAARWYRKARLSEWPSEQVTASISALECLLLDGMATQTKGRQLAGHATRLVRVPDMTKTEVEEWLSGIYKERNAIVHEGRWYLADVEVARLVKLLEALVKWASGHLEDEHEHRDRSDRPVRACTTREDVLSASQARLV